MSLILRISGSAGRALFAVVLALGATAWLAGGPLQSATAAEEHTAKEHNAEGAGHQPEGPMTAKKSEVDLALWSLVTFVVFVLLLKKVAWAPIIEALDGRENKILDNIASAENARIKAERLLADHQAKLDKVQDEVRGIMAEARRDAEHTKNEIVAVAQKEADAAKQRAVLEIERARDQALDELFLKMGHAVKAATEQVVGRTLTDADHERLIDEALAGVSRR